MGPYSLLWGHIASYGALQPPMGPYSLLWVHITFYGAL